MPPSPSGASATNSAAASNHSSPPDNDSRVVVLGVVLAVVGVLLIAGIVYMTIRSRRRELGSADESSSTSKVAHRPNPSHGISLNRDHVAARITPFGSLGGEAPRFAHRPGEHMRIATRRSDGGWHFSDPRTPASPMSPYAASADGHDSALPSPAPSALTFTTYSSHHPLLRSDHGHSPLAMSSKELEAQMYSERARSQLHLGLPDSDYPVEEAPPAYVYDGGSSARGQAGHGSLPSAPH